VSGLIRFSKVVITSRKPDREFLMSSDSDVVSFPNSHLDYDVMQ
jgi:hypothetical protein